MSNTVVISKNTHTHLTIQMYKDVKAKESM